MLKFQECATAEDLKTAASIERKRRFEEERKLRIFNPRVRKFGVRDVPCLFFRAVRNIVVVAAPSPNPSAFYFDGKSVPPSRSPIIDVYIIENQPCQVLP